MNCVLVRACTSESVRECSVSAVFILYVCLSVYQHVTAHRREFPEIKCMCDDVNLFG